MGIAVNPSPNEQLLSLTREMLASAEANEWERLATLEQTRLPIFHHIFAQGISSNVELAREILLLDEKIMQLAQAGMPVLQNELLMMRNSDKASNAYQAVQNATLGDG